jgi:hypothetical protein
MCRKDFNPPKQEEIIPPMYQLKPKPINFGRRSCPAFNILETMI